jgi:hypothetical protein
LGTAKVIWTKFHTEDKGRRGAGYLCTPDLRHRPGIYTAILRNTTTTSIRTGLWNKNRTRGLQNTKKTAGFITLFCGFVADLLWRILCREEENVTRKLTAKIWIISSNYYKLLWVSSVTVRRLQSAGWLNFPIISRSTRCDGTGTVEKWDRSSTGLRKVQPLRRVKYRPTAQPDCRKRALSSRKPKKRLYIIKHKEEINYKRFIQPTNNISLHIRIYNINIAPTCFGAAGAPSSGSPIGSFGWKHTAGIASLPSLIRHLWRNMGTISSGSFGLAKDGAPAARKHVGTRLIF